MKRLILIFLCFLPCASQAVKIADCDRKPFDVTIVNGGQKRVVTLTPSGGSVEEFGPTVSFQLDGQKPIVITGQRDEYCIWNGRINIQRREPGNDSNGGF